MSAIRFDINPKNFPIGKTTTVNLEVVNQNEAALFNLSMRLKAGANIRIFGSPRLQIPQLAPGETYQCNLKLQGNKTGTAEIRFERINGRLGGRTLDYPDFICPIRITSLDDFPIETLSLVCNPLQVDQNIQANLQLRLSNGSSFPIEEVILQCKADQMDIRAGEDIQVGRLPARHETVHRLVVLPWTPGKHQIQVRVSGLVEGQKIGHTFSSTLTVRPDTRPQEQHTHYHGDILQVGRGHSIGNLPNPNGNQIADENKFSLPVNTSPEPGESLLKKQRLCPDCKTEVPTGRFCDRCGYRFEAEA